MAPPPDLARLLQQIQYPGMTYVESRITQAWLEEHGREYDSIEFNVRLGAGTPAPDGSLPETERMALSLSQKRADFIAWRGRRAEICEVKIRAGLAAAGQLQGYATLLRREDPSIDGVTMTVVARQCDADTEWVFRSLGIGLQCYPRV